ncbi:MAG: protein translocase subunit SecD [Proteobacteria bacterium]|nr:protein translocase subunit SecD [Cystobacterineae bacterium]MCL2259503.1 protein translocase subunit SecD [Cystobacterineae bacterium]MCL2314023.1 protein translocase subunit SecD [Pseudomonadota bacterium]
MKLGSGWWTRLVIIVLVTLFSFWFLVPTYYSLFVLERKDRNKLEALEKVLPWWAPPARYRLSLGLDLQGGVYMIMRVDTQTALMKRTDRRSVQISTLLKEKKLEEVLVESKPEQRQIRLTAKDTSMAASAEKALLAAFEDFEVALREGESFTLQLKGTEAKRFETEALEQALLVVRQRIDKWGVAEVDLRKLGTDSIQVSLPGHDNPEQARDLIGKTAQLEFILVDEERPDFFAKLYNENPPAPELGIELGPGAGMAATLIAKESQAILDYVEGKIPEDRVVLLECEVAQTGPELPEASKASASCSRYLAYLLEKTVSMTGDSLASADVVQGERGRIVVSLSFDAQGTKEFAELTTQHKGRRLAIVLDGNVYSAPVLMVAITDGRAQISNDRDMRPQEQQFADAKMLALVLKTGAMPAPVSVGESRQVGASLGDELIKKGSLAAVVGLLLVVLFMAIYYKVTGLVANVALMLNGLLILAGLAIFGATLTLPGIAGFVLTLGMAVDANVLINERIREELDGGNVARVAVDKGYDRAFWTIFDSHITTLFAAAILFTTGTGPIRGFAATLIIGMSASLFTAIVVTRLITTYLVHGRGAKTVSI